MGDDTPGSAGGFACNRRGLLAGALGVPVLVCVPSAIVTLPLAAPEPHLDPHWAFFADRPQIDPSGKLPPYRPPAGHRGGGALAALDEERLRYLMPFMT